TALSREIRQIECTDNLRLSLNDIGDRIKFFAVDTTRRVERQILWCKSARCVGVENRVDGIPSEFCPLITRCKSRQRLTKIAVNRGAIGIKRRHARQAPRKRRTQIEVGRRTVKDVDVDGRFTLTLNGFWRVRLKEYNLSEN